MSVRRGRILRRVVRRSGGPPASAGGPPPPRPDPGRWRPVRSGPPERDPVPGPGPRAGAPDPEPEGPNLRLVLVSRDRMLAGALRSLIGAPGGVRMLDWHSDDLDSAVRDADVVVVDMPADLHERTFAVIDGRFLGRTVVLLQEGEHAEAISPGPGRVVLYRPLQIGELWMAIVGTALAPPAPEPEPEAGVEAVPEPEGPEEQEVAAEAAPEPEGPDEWGTAAGALEPVVEEAGGPAGAAPGVERPERGLPVAESGRLIGPSGRELEPVIGPGQVAPGMDEATLERLRRWEVHTRRSDLEQPAPARRRAAREESRRARAARAEARRAARAEAARERAARAQARKVARAEARQARKVARAEARRDRAVRAQVRRAARRQAWRATVGRAGAVRRTAAGPAGAARRVAVAWARAAGRVTTGGARAAGGAAVRGAQAAGGAAVGGVRVAAWAAVGGVRVARGRVAAGLVGVGRAVRVGAGGLARPAVVVVVLAALGLAAAGWRGGGGPDMLAGEVATVRAAGSGEGDLVVQEPRVGPVGTLHALAVEAWLRATEAGGSLEAAVAAARTPSRLLLAVAVALVVLLTLLLMRVGPGTGAAAGPGPAPPQPWRLGMAGMAGALVALDPLVVRAGRTATATVLALMLALGALLLAWALPARPALRWLPAVAAVGGLALLASPLALPVLAVPTVAALLEGRHREARRAAAALGLAAGLWLVLPAWVAANDLTADQAGWLLGRPPGRGPVTAWLAASPPTWLLLAAGLAAALISRRHGSGARSVAWAATTAAGPLAALVLGYPVEQVLPFAVPAAAAAVASATPALAAVRGTPRSRRALLAGVGAVLAGLLAAQAVDWGARYRTRADDGLGRLVATVAAQVPVCSAINAAGPDDRTRLLVAGHTVTEFSSGPAAHAAGVRYFVLTGDRGPGPMTPALAAWVRQRGTRLAAHPSRTLRRVELWRVDAAPLDPVADRLPVPGGSFFNVAGSACGGYRVVDSQVGAFHTAYEAVGGKAVLGRPLGSVWTSDGPALQAFDTMVLGAVPASVGPPAVRPIELPPLLAKLDAEAVADAGIPLPSARPPVTDGQARAMLEDRVIARAYLGTDPATASPQDWRRARDRFGRPLGLPQVMPDGAVRQPFERVVLELPADGGPARPAYLGHLAVRLGLVPQAAMEPEPVPGLPPEPAETPLDPGPLLRLLAALTAGLALAAGLGAVAAWRPGTQGAGRAGRGR